MPAAKRTTAEAELLVPVGRWRYAVIGLIFGGMFVALMVRAVYLQVIDTDYLQSQGDARYLRVQKDLPTRGMIVDRQGQPLAISTPVDSIWMHPATILGQQDKYAYKQLSSLLGMSRDRILDLARSRQTREFALVKDKAGEVTERVEVFVVCPKTSKADVVLDTSAPRITQAIAVGLNPVPVKVIVGSAIGGVTTLW